MKVFALVCLAIISVCLIAHLNLTLLNIALIVTVMLNITNMIYVFRYQE